MGGQRFFNVPVDVSVVLRLVSIPDRDQDVGVKVVKNVRCSQGEVIEIGLSKKKKG